MTPAASNEHLYEYAVIRFVPRVEREEFINVGLLMMCKRQGWVKARVRRDADRLMLLDKDADIQSALSHLDSIERVAAGKGCDSISTLVPEERFRWLSAVRSACIQTSRPHPGKCASLEDTFERLYTELVS